jgi:hypothetical protein
MADSSLCSSTLHNFEEFNALFSQCLSVFIAPIIGFQWTFVEPDKHPICLAVYVFHVLHLIVLFVLVLLIQAYRINPEENTVVR